MVAVDIAEGVDDSVDDAFVVDMELDEVATGEKVVVSDGDELPLALRVVVVDVVNDLDSLDDPERVAEGKPV